MRIIIIMLLLVGCSTVEPKKEVKVVTAQVPVKVACIDRAPVRPTLRVGARAFPGEVIATQDLIIDLEAFEQYGTDWEAAAAGCIKKE